MSLSIPSGPFFIAPFKVETSGVDFLGMRQVNLDFMDACLPSINNYTRYIRCFSINAWIYWKFYCLAEAKGIEQPTREQLDKFKDKAEILFTWGHDNLNLPGIPGIATKPPAIDGPVELSFAAWKRTAANTSLMAAPTYGPASKNTGGLGFVSPVSGVFYKTVGNGVRLAESLDASLSKIEGYDLLTSFEVFIGNAKNAKDLLPAWDIRSPSLNEQNAFLESFFDEQTIGNNSLIGRRSSTIALIMQILSKSKDPLLNSEIRIAMAYGKLPGGVSCDLDVSLHTTWLRWLTLQVRQAQRLAMESIFSWMERRIMDFHEQDMETILESFIESLKKGIDILPMGDTPNQIMDELFSGINEVSELIAKAEEGELYCLFHLIDQLKSEIAGDSEKIIPYSVRLLFLCAIYCELLGKKEAVARQLNQGRVERISLQHWRHTIGKFENRPYVEFWRFVIEHFILSQHFGVAASRFDGNRQRLRIALEEEGLVPLVQQPLKPFVGDDRLNMALLLAADCGLISISGDGRFSVSTS